MRFKIRTNTIVGTKAKEDKDKASEEKYPGKDEEEDDDDDDVSDDEQDDDANSTAEGGKKYNPAESLLKVVNFEKAQLYNTVTNCEGFQVMWPLEKWLHCIQRLPYKYKANMRDDAFTVARSILIYELERQMSPRARYNKDDPNYGKLLEDFLVVKKTLPRAVSSALRKHLQLDVLIEAIKESLKSDQEMNAEYEAFVSEGGFEGLSNLQAENAFAADGSDDNPEGTSSFREFDAANTERRMKKHDDVFSRMKRMQDAKQEARKLWAEEQTRDKAEDIDDFEKAVGLEIQAGADPVTGLYNSPSGSDQGSSTAKNANSLSQSDPSIAGGVDASGGNLGTPSDMGNMKNEMKGMKSMMKATMNSAMDGSMGEMKEGIEATVNGDGQSTVGPAVNGEQVSDNAGTSENAFDFMSALGLDVLEADEAAKHGESIMDFGASREMGDVPTGVNAEYKGFKPNQYDYNPFSPENASLLETKNKKAKANTANNDNNMYSSTTVKRKVRESSPDYAGVNSDNQAQAVAMLTNPSNSPTSLVTVDNSSPEFFTYQYEPVTNLRFLTHPDVRDTLPQLFYGFTSSFRGDRASLEDLFLEIQNDIEYDYEGGGFKNYDPDKDSPWDETYGYNEPTEEQKMVYEAQKRAEEGDYTGADLPIPTDADDNPIAPEEGDAAASSEAQDSSEASAVEGDSTKSTNDSTTKPVEDVSIPEGDVNNQDATAAMEISEAEADDPKQTDEAELAISHPTPYDVNAHKDDESNKDGFRDGFRMAKNQDSSVTEDLDSHSALVEITPHAHIVPADNDIIRREGKF